MKQRRPYICGRCPKLFQGFCTLFAKVMVSVHPGVRTREEVYYERKDFKASEGWKALELFSQNFARINPRF